MLINAGRGTQVKATQNPFQMQPSFSSQIEIASLTHNWWHGCQGFPRDLSSVLVHCHIAERLWFGYA
jgi:hypothetical protein